MRLGAKATTSEARRLAPIVMLSRSTDPTDFSSKRRGHFLRLTAYMPTVDILFEAIREHKKDNGSVRYRLPTTALVPGCRLYPRSGRSNLMLAPCRTEHCEATVVVVAMALGADELRNTKPDAYLFVPRKFFKYSSVWGTDRSASAFALIISVRARNRAGDTVLVKAGQAIATAESNKMHVRLLPADDGALMLGTKETDVITIQYLYLSNMRVQVDLTSCLL